MRQKLLFAFVLVGLLMAQPACSGPLTYSAEAIEAWVVDAETKKPLEGVVVTANWQLIEGTPGGSVPVGQLMVLEAVSDKNGRFYFPPWGPKKAPKGHFASDDPQLLLFKSGYEYRRLSNSASTDRKRALRPVRRSEWNGKTIELKRFTGTPEEWLKMLERVIPPFEKPEDAKQSLMLRAILEEESSIPNSIERKRVFFDGIVRYFLEGK